MKDLGNGFSWGVKHVTCKQNCFVSAHSAEGTAHGFSSGKAAVTQIDLSSFDYLLIHTPFPSCFMPLTGILFSLLRKRLQEGAWGKYKDCSCKLQIHQRNSALNKAIQDTEVHTLSVDDTEWAWTGMISRAINSHLITQNLHARAPSHTLQFHWRLP